MKRKICIGFDLDMTLVDSSGAIAEVMTRTLSLPHHKSCIKELPSKEEMKRTIGRPLKEAFLDWIYIERDNMNLDDRICKEKEREKEKNIEIEIEKEKDRIAEEMVSDYRGLFEEVGMPLLSLLPYARETLECIQQYRDKDGDRDRDRGRGIEMQVLLVSSRKSASVLSIVSHLSLSSFFDCIEGGLYGEEKGRYLLEKEASIYIGDHPGDIIGAKTANALSIAVETGHVDRKALEAEEPDLLWENLSPFPSWLGEYIESKGEK